METKPILSKAKRRALYQRIANRIKRSKWFNHKNLWVCYQLADLTKGVISNRNSMTEIVNQFPEFGNFLYTDMKQYPTYLNSVAFSGISFATDAEANTARIDALLLCVEMCK